MNTASEVRRPGFPGASLDLILGFCCVGLVEAWIVAGLVESGTATSTLLWRATWVHAVLGLVVALLLGLLGRWRPGPALMTGLLVSILAYVHVQVTFSEDLRAEGRPWYWSVLAATCLPVLVGWWLGRRPGRGRLLTRALIALLLVGVVAGTAIRDQAARASVHGPNVLFIVLDTTRKDRMSAYGYHRPTTPTLSRMAAEGTLFERAVSSSPWTLPSHASMFTGLHPSQHGATRPSHWLHDDIPTLAETMAVTGRRVVAFGKKAWLAGESGVMRGFQDYVDLLNPVPPKPAGVIVDMVRRDTEKTGSFADDKGAAEINWNVFQWLRENPDEPFFIFINLNETHAHLEPPAPYREDYLGERVESPWGRGKNPDLIAFNAGKVIYSEEDVAIFNDLYDAEVAYQDARLGELFEFLRDRDLLDDTLMIVTADHGESLGEHQEFGHGPCMHEPVLNVPLILRHPDLVPAGAVIETPVETRHLARFVEQAVDAGVELAGDGLLRALAPDSSDGLIVSEVYQRLVPRSRARHNMWAVRVQDYKLIYSSRGHHELYDLAEDPAELHNLADERPALVQRLADFARQHQERRREAGPAADLDPQTLEHLQAMGYVVGNEDS